MNPDGETLSFQCAEYSCRRGLTPLWCRCRLWRDVTMNLKLKDIDAATEAKHRLEEKQRAEARERKEKEQQWETRVSSATHHAAFYHHTRWYLPARVLRLRFNMTTIVTACVFAAFPWRRGVLGVRWASIKAVSLSEAMRRHTNFYTHIQTHTHMRA